MFCRFACRKHVLYKRSFIFLLTKFSAVRYTYAVLVEDVIHRVVCATRRATGGFAPASELRETL
jgi:hypothetical protein